YSTATGSPLFAGSYAGRYATGIAPIFLGHNAGANSPSSRSTAIGSDAMNSSSSNDSNGYGHFSARFSTGNRINGIGTRTLYYADGSKNNAIGYYSFSDFYEDESTAKTFTTSDVNTSTERITITSHGFGNTGETVNLKYSGTSLGAGIAN